MALEDYSFSEEDLKRFGQAARINSRKSLSMTANEWNGRGLKMFKRRAIGICRNTRTMPILEVARILVDLKICDSIESGESFVQRNYGKWEYYPGCLNSIRILSFNRVYNSQGQELCKIESEYLSVDPC